MGSGERNAKCCLRIASHIYSRVGDPGLLADDRVPLHSTEEKHYSDAAVLPAPQSIIRSIATRT